MTSKKEPQKKSSAKSRPSSRTPKTMEDLLAQAESELVTVSRGKSVKGIITEITKKSVLVDIGGKSEAMIAERAFNEAREYISNLEVGDEIEATVLVPETPDGYTILSLRRASQNASWEKIENSLVKGTPINASVNSSNPAGVTVEINGLSGFIPNSLLGKENSKNPQRLIGNSISAVVVEAERSSNKIVLSEKAVTEAGQIKLVQKALKKIKAGDKHSGVVTNVTDFGCFVRIEVNVKKEEDVTLEGLVHVSELSWKKVVDPRTLVKEGDDVKVVVVSKELPTAKQIFGRLSLSMKQAKPDPWEKAVKVYKKDSKAKGKVVRVSDFGAFVELEPGVEGLIHMTKIPPGSKVIEGKEVEVYIEDIDKKERKLSLGLVLTAKPVGYK